MVHGGLLMAVVQSSKSSRTARTTGHMGFRSRSPQTRPAALGCRSANSLAALIALVAASLILGGCSLSGGNSRAGQRVYWSIEPTPLYSLAQGSCTPGGDCLVQFDAPKGQVDIALLTIHGVQAVWPQRKSEHPAGFSCSSDTRCIGITPGRSQVLLTDDSGRRWVVASTPHAFDAWSVACTPEICVILGTVGNSPVSLTSTDSGASWSIARMPPNHGLGTYGAVQCSIRTCFATGAEGGLVTKDGLGSWKRVPLRFEGTEGVIQVACTRTASCAALIARTQVVHDSVITSDHLTWLSSGGLSTQGRAKGLLPNPQEFAFACPTRSVCFLSEYNLSLQELARTVDGGASWERMTLPSGATVFWLSCFSSVACVGDGLFRRHPAFIFGTPKPNDVRSLTSVDTSASSVG